MISAELPKSLSSDDFVGSIFEERQVGFILKFQRLVQNNRQFKEYEGKKKKRLEDMRFSHGTQVSRAERHDNYREVADLDRQLSQMEDSLEKDVTYRQTVNTVSANIVFSMGMDSSRSTEDIVRNDPDLRVNFLRK